jgi:mono/diheme cytochrome c family protein
VSARSTIVGLTLLCAGCETSVEPTHQERVAAASSALVEQGRTLAAEYECVRCHQVPTLKAADPKKDCVGCHQKIEAGDFDAPPEILAEWQDHLVHLQATPDLGGARRFRRVWLEQFLLDPHDLRPGIEATMPRLEIDPDQAKALAAFLSPAAELEWESRGDPVRGRQIFESRDCASCHVFSGLDEPLLRSPPKSETAAATVLAPDLRHARERMRPDVMESWLRDPASVHDGALMPSFGLDAKEIQHVAAFILQAPFTEPDPIEVPPRLPVLDRPVSYAEVDAQVFKKTCWHCHSDPDYAPMGDGGPGNTGGLGFAGRGLDLATHASMASGAKGDDGKRRSIFRKLEDGTPALVAHLYARQLEVAGRPVDGVRGMPLGLPPLSLEEIQLVETWIAQGRPRQ